MITKRIALSAALLATTGLIPVSTALAQDAETAQAAQPDDVITVRYQFVPDDKRVTSEVSSFLDVDDMGDFHFPDLSHLNHTDAPRFTRILAEELVRRGVVQPADRGGTARSPVQRGPRASTARGSSRSPP